MARQSAFLFPKGGGIEKTKEESDLPLQEELTDMQGKKVDRGKQGWQAFKTFSSTGGDESGRSVEWTQGVPALKGRRV